MKNSIVILSAVASVFIMSCKDNASSKITGDTAETTAQNEQAPTAATNTTGEYPIMTFDKQEHDFGTIAANTPVETIFKFTNTGKAPLIITNATSSCGCTVPQYPKDTPIAPGESGEILVKFNGSGKNLVTKTVTITANTQNGTEVVRIKAFVEGSGEACSPLVKQPSVQ